MDTSRAQQISRETNDYSVADQVATISFSRPERRNALDSQVFRDLIGALDDAEDDPDVHVVVITGQGPAFCAGQNLKFTLEATLDEKEEYQRLNYAGRDRIRRLEKPVVARVQGDALGGGTYVATSCDLVVAVKSARFAMREIHSGEQSGGAHLFTIGRARSNEMNLLGRYVGAEEAERWGLINRAVEPDDLDRMVQEFTDQLRALPPIGLKYTKISQNLLLDMAGFAVHVQARAGHPYLFLTEDAKEARRSFGEKRKPNFQGR